MGRLALRAGLVPAPAAEAWCGIAASGVLVAAVRTGMTARLAGGYVSAAEIAASRDLDPLPARLDPLPARLLLDCLHSAGHVTVRGGHFAASLTARRSIPPGVHRPPRRPCRPAPPPSRRLSRCPGRDLTPGPDWRRKRSQARCLPTPGPPPPG